MYGYRNVLVLLEINIFFQSIEDCKAIMLNRGLLFLKKLNEARGKIVKLAMQFIVDDSVIWIYFSCILCIYFILSL